ncbi:MAG TPA: galactokinase [bacterium]|uniref:Galactokinase n=1 Tax=candidate division TA06 bacterium ADurb.Bin417 TaxID=1852828 RepID=A0A1V5MIL0_UNCT6|nr:MAG: Galactokinase [candidate division TA06 bacterium ADurb.Bin417]HNQ35289.1 galactokinase [bacterium]HNS48408.1 galactokinase [bacterium]
MVTAQSPGRVEILGNHTDYNEGFVLLAAIDLRTTVSGRRASGSRGRIFSARLDQSCEFSLDRVEKDPERAWADYPKGVVRELRRLGVSLPGFEARIESALPFGAGLSSSAALELAFGFFLQGLAGFDLSRLEMVKLCRRAENEFVGVGCGILDQFGCAFGRADSLLWLDCRTLDYEVFRLPARAAVVVCDSGRGRRLAASGYNRRRRECSAALDFFAGRRPGLAALRDLEPEDFRRLAPGLADPALRNRAEHVVNENRRVREAAGVLRRGDLARLGELMRASHSSSRDLFENSTPELDFLVETAYRQPGIIGAKLSGAGWGGATVNLVAAGAAGDFARRLRAAFRAEFGREPAVYLASIPDGAGLVND